MGTSSPPASSTASKLPRPPELGKGFLSALDVGRLLSGCCNVVESSLHWKRLMMLFRARSAPSLARHGCSCEEHILTRSQNNSASWSASNISATAYSLLAHIFLTADQTSVTPRSIRSFTSLKEEGHPCSEVDSLRDRRLHLSISKKCLKVCSRTTCLVLLAKHTNSNAPKTVSFRAHNLKEAINPSSTSFSFLFSSVKDVAWEENAAPRLEISFSDHPYRRAKAYKENCLKGFFVMSHDKILCPRR
mmetsp:Transcript_28860/g.46698  ORF Transcript_28860/g.46698 Transcript_28860/m.46698 type:complete len:247 (+) Transcript_28860:4276-5016(+)